MKQQEKRGIKGKSSALSDLLIDEFTVNSRFAESYRTLQINIQFSLMGKAFRSLLVTSASEQEGKTSTVINLAYSMAQAGKTVLMVDTDLRKPMLSKVVGHKDAQGISGLLSDGFSADVRSGSLPEFGFSDLFWLASFQKKTGFLHLIDGKEQLKISFLQGEPVDVHWLTRPKEKRLATVLMKNKVLTWEQVKQAIARQRRTGEQFGLVLINMGFVREDDLAGYVNFQIIEGLRTALQFRAGKFSFKDVPESYFERPSFSPWDVRELYKQVVFGGEELPYLRKKIGAATRKSDTENLFVLPSGSPPANPAQMLASNRMSFLLSYLKKRFDVLVLDSSPILPASDAMLLAPQTEAVALVVKAAQVDRRMVQKAVEQLEVAQANLIGVVLNQVDTKKEGYYKYYHKYYAKYYGETTPAAKHEAQGARRMALKSQFAAHGPQLLAQRAKGVGQSTMEMAQRVWRMALKSQLAAHGPQLLAQRAKGVGQSTKGVAQRVWRMARRAKSKEL